MLLFGLSVCSEAVIRAGLVNAHALNWVGSRAAGAGTPGRDGGGKARSAAVVDLLGWASENERDDEVPRLMLG